MTRPAPAVGRVRLHILGNDAATSKGYLSADGATGMHSKAVDGSSLSFTASALEAAMVADPTMLEDTFAVAELDVAGTWTAFGTPFLLSPGSGTVLGEREGAARDEVPVGVGALQGLLSECVVLPTEADPDSPTFRYAPAEQYRGWQSKGYTEDGTWHDADVVTRASLASGAAKKGEPSGWEDEDADWVYRDSSHGLPGDTGGLTLLRFPAFTLAARAKVKIVYAADEESALYVDGPNMGGKILESGDQETGYTNLNVWAKVLEPGTYQPYGEFTTITTPGGDGFDAISMYACTVDSKGRKATVLSRSGPTTRVHRQAKEATRPGMSIGETVRRELQANADQGIDAATILLANKNFTDSLDSAGATFDAGQEWTWPVGTSLATVVADMSEDADFDLTTGFGLRIWNDHGSDLSATVKLTPGGSSPAAGMNLAGYGWDADPVGPTRYVTLSQDGFDVVVGTSAETSTRPRFGYLESGSSASIARARSNANAAIRQSGRVRRYYRARVLSVAGARPELDFGVCDVVDGRNYRNVATDLEVTGIGWEQGATAMFVVELGQL